jgi:hypothetical protein
MEIIKILGRIKLGILILATVPINMLLYTFRDSLRYLKHLTLHEIFIAYNDVPAITFAVRSLDFLFFLWIVIYVIQSYLLLHYRVPVKVLIIMESIFLGYLYLRFFEEGHNPLITVITIMIFLMMVVLVFLYFAYEKSLKNERR